MIVQENVITNVKTTLITQKTLYAKVNLDLSHFDIAAEVSFQVFRES